MSDVASILPPNATTGERLLEQVTARVGAVDVPIDTLWDPTACPADLLPWLAWSVGVEVWSSEWPEAQKRAAIAAAPYVKRHKGTRAALDRALGVLGYGCTVTEWFEATPPAAPFTFEVSIDVSTAGATEDEQDQILAAVASAKNLRSHLSALLLSSTMVSDGYTAAATFAGDTFVLGPLVVTELDPIAPLALGATTIGYDQAEVYPSS